MSFSLLAEKRVYQMKHYDVKNLNFLLQDGSIGHEDGDHERVRMEYSYDGKVYGVEMPRDSAVIAKLADYGTADMKGGDGGGKVTLGNFTTLENTPADFLVLGEDAGQGYGHDEWGLGLCLWHLATGDCPYEEIMEEVKCPERLRERISEWWEDEERDEFGVVRSLINADVYEDGDEKDYTLHDTLYRYAVMFGIDKVGGSMGKGGEFIAYFKGAIEGDRKVNKAYEKHRRRFGCDVGVEERVKRGRECLMGMEGGWECFVGLTNWNKEERWSFEDVVKGRMMDELVGEKGDEDGVLAFRYKHFERLE